MQDLSTLLQKIVKLGAVLMMKVEVDNRRREGHSVWHSWKEFIIWHDDLISCIKTMKRANNIQQHDKSIKRRIAKKQAAEVNEQ